MSRISQTRVCVVWSYGRGFRLRWGEMNFWKHVSHFQPFEIESFCLAISSISLHFNWRSTKLTEKSTVDYTTCDKKPDIMTRNRVLDTLQGKVWGTCCENAHTLCRYSVGIWINPFRPTKLTSKLEPIEKKSIKINFNVSISKIGRKSISKINQKWILKIDQKSILINFKNWSEINQKFILKFDQKSSLKIDQKSLPIEIN